MVKNFIIVILIALLTYSLCQSKELPEQKFHTYSLVSNERGIFKVNHETGQVYYFVKSLFIELKTVEVDELDNLLNTGKPNSLLKSY